MKFGELRGVGRLRKAGEQGQALVLSIVVLLVLTAAAATAAGLITSTQNTSSNERQGVRALTGGEAGLDLAANSVAAAWNATSTLPGDNTTLTGSQSVDGSNVNWTATYRQPADPSLAGSWTLQADVWSPTHKVHRLLQEKLQPTTTSTNVPPAPAYQYGFFMADPNAPCSTDPSLGNAAAGNGNVSTWVWVAGDMCLNGAGSGGGIENPAGGLLKVYVGGSLTLSGAHAHIGTSTSPVDSATIIGGCFNPGVVPCDQSSSSNVWASHWNDTSPGTFTKPTYDPDQVYQASLTANPCTPTSKTLDDDTTRNTSLTNFQLLPSTAYSCTTPTGSLTWVPGSPGTLTVDGSVYIDGDLNLSGSAVYQGIGTIYFDGTVTMSGGSICGSSNCNGTWDATQNQLEIVAVNHRHATLGWTVSGQGYFEGIALINGGYGASGNGTVVGTIIADYGSVSGNGSSHGAGNPPPEAPGGGHQVSSTSWAVSPGTWRQCPSAAGCS